MSRFLDENGFSAFERVAARIRSPQAADTKDDATAGPGFAQDENGSMTIFSLSIFILMLIIGGMAVDLMRFETRRATIQATVDAAVLAASSVSQTRDPESVVRDYFSKSGLDPSLIVVDVQEDVVGDPGDQTVLARSISANYQLELNTFFMDMIGINTLETPVASAALEGSQNVEISLILDISGSMRGEKIDNLKVAAKEFADTVIDPIRTTGITSISIIPYNGAVVVGSELLDRLNADGDVVEIADPRPYPGALEAYPTEHNFSTCVRFYDDDMIANNLATDYLFLRAIGPNTPLTRVSHFDEGTNSYNQPSMSRRWCNEDRANILVHATETSVLDAHIDSLTAGGWTSIENGMKWGVALLDPAMRPVVNDMVDDNVLNEGVRNRPGNYSNNGSLTGTMKIVVLMTDGDNTIQNDLRQEYKNGPSRVWFSESAADPDDASFPIIDEFGDPDGREKTWYDGYFVEFPDNLPHERWLRPLRPGDRYDGVYYHAVELPPDAQQLTYHDLHERFAEEDIARFFFRNEDNTAYNEHRNAVTTVESYGSIDARLRGICDAAKVQNDILVFTIAFEAPLAGEAAMQNCATAAGYYYDVSGTDISEAFSSIAGQITKLRLTQ